MGRKGFIRAFTLACEHAPKWTGSQVGYRAKSTVALFSGLIKLTEIMAPAKKQRLFSDYWMD